MSRIISLFTFALFVTACSDGTTPVAPQEAATLNDVDPGGANAGVVYTGRGVAVDATVDGSNTKLCDTGALPKDGGRIANTSQTASISGVLSASKLYCITTSATSGEPRAISEATLWGMNVTVGGNTITADWLHSMAGARCPTDATPFSSGSSFFTNLRVNGRTIALQKTPNRKIELPNGYIVVNEQTSFVTPWHAGRTVIGLRIVITRNGSADVVLARSQTHIDCP